VIDLTGLQSAPVILQPSFGWGIPMSKLFARFLNDQSGATAIEYGLIAAGISIAIITVVNGLGTNLNDKFTSINSSLK
jgi:pilus assembly protein Flp/PilA